MATRAQLRTRARTRADQDDSTFPSDTEYNDWLDEAAKEVWYDLIQAGWPINFSEASKTATGSNPLALGVTGVAFVRGVFRLSSGRYIELARLNEGDRGTLMGRSGDASYYNVRIDPALGAVVELLPLPSSGTYVIQYVPEHPGFAADATEWYGPARSDELLTLKAAAKGCRKEGNDQGAMALDREYLMLLDKVQSMSSWFDMRNAATVRDVVDPIGARKDPFDFDV
jgi:hypothetical protein